jgi:hypothetical protein
MKENYRINSAKCCSYRIENPSVQQFQNRSMFIFNLKGTLLSQQFNKPYLFLLFENTLFSELLNGDILSISGFCSRLSVLKGSLKSAIKILITVFINIQNSIKSNIAEKWSFKNHLEK